MNKIRCMCAGLLAGALLLSVPVGAASPQTQELIQTQTFETMDTDFHAQFDSLFETRITRSGKQYELSHIGYQVVKEEKQEEDTETTYEMDFRDLYSKEEAHPQESISIERGGETQTFQLDTVTYQPQTIQNRTGTVTATTDFDLKTTQPHPEQTKTVSYQDKQSGQIVPVTLDFKELRLIQDWGWVNDVSIPLQVSMYDAEYYQLGEELISYNPDRPAIQGHENTILQQLGLDTGRYRIENAQWSGEPYQVGEIIYRDAVATGSRYAAHYEAVYESTVSLPDCPGWTATAHYKASDTSYTGESLYTVEASAAYVPIPNSYIWIAAIAGSSLLLLLAAAMTVWFLMKRRKREKQTEIDGIDL